MRCAAGDDVAVDAGLFCLLIVAILSFFFTYSTFFWGISTGVVYVVVCCLLFEWLKGRRVVGIGYVC